MEQHMHSSDYTDGMQFPAMAPTVTGQTTVNKKAPIHDIISINDKVYRPL